MPEPGALLGMKNDGVMTLFLCTYIGFERSVKSQNAECDLN
jgi:hypothetical protein